MKNGAASPPSSRRRSQRRWTSKTRARWRTRGTARSTSSKRRRTRSIATARRPSWTKTPTTRRWTTDGRWLLAAGRLDGWKPSAQWPAASSQQPSGHHSRRCALRLADLRQERRNLEVDARPADLVTGHIVDHAERNSHGLAGGSHPGKLPRVASHKGRLENGMRLVAHQVPDLRMGVEGLMIDVLEHGARALSAPVLVARGHVGVNHIVGQDTQVLVLRLDEACQQHVHGLGGHDRPP